MSFTSRYYQNFSRIAASKTYPVMRRHRQPTRSNILYSMHVININFFESNNNLS